MKILFLTGHLPYPPLSGGRRREFELISRLSKNFEIHLCSITKSWETDNIFTNELLSYCESVKLFKANPTTNNQRYEKYPTQMKKHTSEEARSYISSLTKCQSFDIVHVEGYYLLQHAPTKFEFPVILVEHNIEYLLALQHFRIAKTQEEKYFFWSEYVKTLKWEQFMWKQATLCVALTHDDKATMDRLQLDLDVRLIPNGSDHQKKITISERGLSSLTNTNNLTPVISSNCHSILFVGNFAYEPNVDAAIFFSHRIFPLILRDVPNAKLFLVGNAPPEEIWSLASNRQIEVTGPVASLIPFYDNADVVICPLRIGGGIKVKVLEALALGKAVVSTSVGAQGIDLSTCRPVIVADEEEEFAKNVIRLLLDPKQRHIQEQEALAYARNLPSWDDISEAFSKCYKELARYRSVQEYNEGIEKRREEQVY
jgi:polysaccharide biosynthesis protein PslH